MRNYGQCIDRHPDASQEFDKWGGQIVKPKKLNLFDEIEEEEVAYWGLLDDEEAPLDANGHPIAEEDA